MRLAFVGDIALFGKFDLRRNNLGDYFSDVKSILDGCDYRIGNLELLLLRMEVHPVINLHIYLLYLKCKAIEFLRD